MPLIALAKALDRDAYYAQTNNVIEAVIRKTLAGQGVDRGWLETCGPTAAVNILAAQGDRILSMTPGGWEPQPEDILAAWFNDPRNAATLSACWPGLDPDKVFGNEVARWYAAAVPAVYGIPARYFDGCTWDNLLQALTAHRGVLVTLVNPGHYVGVVGVNTDDKTVLYHDSWPNNPWPASLAGKPARARVLSWTEFSANLKPQRVEIG